MINFIKSLVEKIPYRIGSKVKYIPYNLRLGKSYNDFKSFIPLVNEFSIVEKEQYVISHFNKVFQYAKKNYFFYNNLYKKYGVYDLEIKSLNDISKLPIVTKKMIREHLDDFSGKFRLNTGGTSGEPFLFFVDKNAWAREWAHMHNIWSFKDYKPTDVKITLRGKDLGQKNITYNPVHNEFILNTYKPLSTFFDEFMDVFFNKKVKYIHGYPSAIYSFLKQLELLINNSDKKKFINQIRSCFFGSEYPTEQIKNYINKVWGIDFISWYGHSEMCILAYDVNSENNYIPYYTYGYAEVFEGKLLGTSYFNYDMPLIRYDTGDVVKPTYKNSKLLHSFEVTEGREGDFIIDNNGHKIPLTSLIFGRHHLAFEFVDFIQVKQDEKSNFIIFYLSKSNSLQMPKKEVLNLNNVDITYEIKMINSPFKTKAGKVKLKL